VFVAIEYGYGNKENACTFGCTDGGFCCVENLVSNYLKFDMF
jgi:hypothetical protein